jgi:endonuclease/exonuclease/phosphatase family metal-dependent hydrolase
MDDPTFDPRATDPDFETSRRRLLGGLAGGTLAGVLGWRETAADRKRQDKHDNKSQKRRRDQGDKRQDQGDDTRQRDGESTQGGSSSALGAGESKQGGNSPALKVLTRNLYLGADLAPTFRVGNPTQLVEAVTKVFGIVQATNFPERAKALADEIAALDPHIVCLQEVSHWRSGPSEYSEDPPILDLTPNAEDDVYDFLTILLSELSARGKSYAEVATVHNFDTEAPRRDGDAYQDIRISDRDVILARTDLSKNVFSVVNKRSGNFGAALPIQLLGKTILVLRGWTAVTVNLQGRAVQVVNTHLEGLHPFFQDEQAKELLADPLNTSLPTVLLGDLNSAATKGATYQKMLNQGEFADAWTTTRGDDPGFTWGHAEDLSNPTPSLTQRIDFVLTRGGITASSANRVGHEPEDRTPSGLWPSDHVGVWAVLRLKDA